MARTLIGQLILTLKQDFGEQAKQVDTAVDGIERSIKRLQSAPWGSAFQRQLDSIKATPSELKAVQRSWADTFGAMSKADFKSALDKANFADWRNGVVQHLGAVRSEMAETEKRTQRFANTLRATLRPVVGLLGYVGGGYIGYQLGSGATKAYANRGQEVFREQMAGLRAVDMASLGASSLNLSTQYRNASETEIRQMGLRALSAMGTMDRTIDILPTLTQALVTLKSAKGDTGANQLGQLMKGIDVTGLNVSGPQGVKNVKDILEGFVRAAQIEGEDLDVGKFWQFARRAKIASSSLSPEFLATVAPAFMQDMGPDTFGTGLSSAYQSFVIGSNAVASKKNLENQEKLGIRNGKGLVGADLFSTNPYEWTKQILVPALKKAGVDMTNDVQVQKAVADLTRNTMASSVITRMVQQQPQVDKSIALYGQTMGLSAATEASAKDPYAAWGGLTSALDNLASAVTEKVGIIAPGLNKLTDAINGMAKWVEDNPAWATGVAGAGVGLAGWGAYAGVKKFGDWLSAGTQLQVAATELQAAAASLQAAAGAGGAAGAATAAGEGVAGAAAGGGLRALAGGALRGILRFSPWVAAAYEAAHTTPVGEGAGTVAKQIPGYRDYELDHMTFPERQVHPVPRPMRNLAESIIPPARDFTADTAATKNFSGSPDDRDHSVRAVTQDAQQAKTALDTVNATVVAPKVDTSSIAAARAQVSGLLNDLNSVNSWRPHIVGGPMDSARDQLDRSFADHGIAP